MAAKKFKKDTDSLLSAAYQKLEASFDELESVPIAEWTVTNSLVYICKRYEKAFNVKFILSYKDTPSASPEHKLVARLWMMLGAKKGDGELIKNYIDWYYKNYNSKVRFTSLGALVRPNLIASFKSVKKLDKIERSTLISSRMRIIVKAFPETAYVKTWGDLAFLKKIIETEDDYPPSYKKIFEFLELDGVDLNKINGVV